MIRAASVALISLLALAACGPGEMAEHDQRQSFPITAEVKQAVAVFDRAEGNGPVSVFDRERLRRLAGESLKRGAGPVVIALAPKPDEASARAFAQSLADELKAAGVAEVQVKLAEDGDGAASVRVPVWVAVVPECGTFDRGLTPDFSNAPHSNWGCAVERNRGLMVQNPADLVRAREATGRDANRAGDVLGKYGRGEATGSAVEEQSAGTTSKVGNSAK
ncbi:Type IV pili component [Paramagnetospirillum marisnigri]|uniref:Type IV pili component n=1 Tax=Paramagnetospirillum marisnigri TaxID=1285242 RepID=A0A178MPE7_9PROT|nr:CpaD family pilus assembly lipoprotein [Paramagnetospirillum marisnigri]OAN50423.1 Type IV pili component [Paramagnetospirillum marisnigri]